MSAKTAALATVHRPLGTHGLWGDKRFQLPAYVQNIAHALMRDGHDESSAVAIAIAQCKHWASGEGNVSAEVRAAAAKAIGEWEKTRAEFHAAHGSSGSSGSSGRSGRTGRTRTARIRHALTGR